MNCSILLKTCRVTDDETRPGKYMYESVTSNAYYYDRRREIGFSWVLAQA